MTRSRTFLISAGAAIANSFIYGFVYGAENHEFDLPLLNWLRNPALYPNDPLKDSFTHFPTVFWILVSHLSHYMDQKNVILLFFAITKLLFFTALGRIVDRVIRDWKATAVILFCIAVSPFLNDYTPLAASDILNSVQTQTSLAIALLLWSAVFLIEDRIEIATIIAAITIYFEALFVLYTAFPIGFFALRQIRKRPLRVVIAGVSGLVVALPYLIYFRMYDPPPFPPNFVHALLNFYPFHLNLQSHAPYELISGFGLIAAAFWMIRVTKKAGTARYQELEWLLISYSIPLVLGALFGFKFLTPNLARAQLLRSDTFVLLYSILILQVYGLQLARSTNSIHYFLVGLTALLVAVTDYLGLLWFLYILFALNENTLESVYQSIRRSTTSRIVLVSVLLLALSAAGLAYKSWSSTIVVLCVVLASSVFNVSQFRQATMLIASALAILMCAVGISPDTCSFWCLDVPPTPLERDWHDVQIWAKDNTPVAARFLVPTFPGGFRTFSERTSYGEWKDGTAIYLIPSFSDEYLRRMREVGIDTSNHWIELKQMMKNYDRLPWEQLLKVAQTNKLDYIVQFRDARYPDHAIYSNSRYAVYKVRP